MSEDMDLTTAEGREEAAAHAGRNKKVMSKIVSALSGASRSKRQFAASTLAIVSNNDPAPLEPHMDEIADALNRPESQTRWECLHSLCEMVAAGQTPDEEVFANVEDALYDEDSGIVREASFRFFCIYGGTNAKASDKAWPLIDEAIQCYHGNPEFPDMLTALADFAAAKISKTTAAALAERMKFDSEMAKGTLRMRSEQIVKACEAHK